MADFENGFLKNCSDKNSDECLKDANNYLKNDISIEGKIFLYERMMYLLDDACSKDWNALKKFEANDVKYISCDSFYDDNQFPIERRKYTTLSGKALCEKKNNPQVKGQPHFLLLDKRSNEFCYGPNGDICDEWVEDDCKYSQDFKKWILGLTTTEFNTYKQENQIDDRKTQQDLVDEVDEICSCEFLVNSTQGRINYKAELDKGWDEGDLMKHPPICNLSTCQQKGYFSSKTRRVRCPTCEQKSETRVGNDNNANINVVQNNICDINKNNTIQKGQKIPMPGLKDDGVYFTISNGKKGMNGTLYLRSGDIDDVTRSDPFFDIYSEETLILSYENNNTQLVGRRLNERTKGIPGSSDVKYFNSAYKGKGDQTNNNRVLFTESDNIQEGNHFLFRTNQDTNNKIEMTLIDKDMEMFQRGDGLPYMYLTDETPLGVCDIKDVNTSNVIDHLYANVYESIVVSTRKMLYLSDPLTSSPMAIGIEDKKLIAVTPDNAALFTFTDDNKVKVGDLYVSFSGVNGDVFGTLSDTADTHPFLIPDGKKEGKDGDQIVLYPFNLGFETAIIGNELRITKQTDNIDDNGTVLWTHDIFWCENNNTLDDLTCPTNFQCDIDHVCKKNIDNEKLPTKTIIFIVVGVVAFVLILLVVLFTLRR
jgi:hypothetical protein